MASTVASLVVDIGADIGGLTRGLRQADNSITGFGRSVTGLGAQLTGLTAPITVGLGAGIKVASDFDSVMAEIGARAGLTADELGKVSDFALQMGADTAFSAQQSADAFLQLLTSGQNVEQAISTLPSVLDAAAASGEDLGQTADTITDIMASFGLEVADAASVVDSLARAAGASSADMGSLGQGFANVGGVARAFGLDVNRTSAILALLSENGVKGAEAGTALKSMLLNMTRPTEKVDGAWQALGTSFYDAEGMARPLTDVLEDIKYGMEGLDEETQNILMTDLAGSYGVVALTALLGAQSIEEMEAAMEGAADAESVAAARMDTFAGRVDSLVGSIETLAITALTPFMNDVLKPLAEQATVVVNKITEWAGANPQLASTVVGIAAAAVVLGPALVVVGLGIQAMGVAIGALGAVLAVIASPLFLAAAGALALGAGIAYLISNDIGGVRTKFEELAAAISSVDFSGAPLNLQTQVSDALSDFGGVAIDTTGVTAWATDNMTTILNTIVSVAGIVFGGPVGAAIGIASLVAKAIDNDFLGIGTFLDTSGIQASIESALQGLKVTIDSLIQGVFSGGNDTANDDAIMAGVMPSGAALSGPLGTFVEDLQKGVGWLSNELPKIIEPIKTGLSDLFAGISGFVANLEGTETEGILRVVTVVAGALGVLVTKLAEVGAQGIGNLLSSIGAALPGFGTALSSFISALSNLGEGDIRGVLSSIGEGLLGLGEAFLGLIGLDIDLPSLEGMIESWRGVFENIPLIVEAMGERVYLAFNGVAVAMRSGIRDIKAEIADAALKLGAAAELVGLDLGFTGDAATEIATIDIAKKLESDLSNSLASGGVLQFDLPQIEWILSDQNPMSAEQTASLVSNLVDPLLIQEAITTALSMGDTEALNLLMPLAIELGIDTAALQAQYNAGVIAAAAGLNPTVTIPVNINAQVSVSGMPTEAGFGYSGSSAVIDSYATGTDDVPQTGLYMLHAGEAVIPANENHGGGRGGNTIIINGAQNVDAMLAELKRRGIVLA